MQFTQIFTELDLKIMERIRDLQQEGLRAHNRPHHPRAREVWDATHYYPIVQEELPIATLPTGTRDVYIFNAPVANFTVNNGTINNDFTHRISNNDNSKRLTINFPNDIIPQ
jgi:hypothetical protein